MLLGFPCLFDVKISPKSPQSFQKDLMIVLLLAGYIVTHHSPQ